VVDWGLPKAIGKVEPGLDSGEQTLIPSSASGSSKTLPGSALGTPAYMSPEKASGDLTRAWSCPRIRALKTRYGTTTLEAAALSRAEDALATGHLETAGDWACIRRSIIVPDPVPLSNRPQGG
jgi:hypothetical protein